ncbi:hypothetical protein U9M48_014052 [Paspalum notatum var. saurae]|uniref:Uncharacterized protein n=1 Tax=Paspalum notatum var. saurae TaxID=547442 RepID=A0AAQ3T220_PASNO
MAATHAAGVFSASRSRRGRARLLQVAMVGCSRAWTAVACVRMDAGDLQVLSQLAPDSWTASGEDLEVDTSG